MNADIEIVIEDRSGMVTASLEPSFQELSLLARQVLARLDFHSGELGVSLVSEREMAQLNHDHLGRTGPTDVLSFPLDTDASDKAGEVPLLRRGQPAGRSAHHDASDKAGEAPLPGRGQPAGRSAHHDASDEAGEVPLLLGDVVICPQVAARQAQELGSTLTQECSLLLIHGILHIAGYDHENDEGEMDALQEKLLEELCTDAAP